MNSVCIKTNNNKILEYLLNDFYKINLDELFILIPLLPSFIIKSQIF